eukprot:GHVR01042814.1.p1 GENE.GHVR01042814.1~~GHVR01042814.1.p1  ORF type:complete len:619 (-),score=75.74 GHVR01042814.1:122-1978(-)
MNGGVSEGRLDTSTDCSCEGECLLKEEDISLVDTIRLCAHFSPLGEFKRLVSVAVNGTMVGEYPVSGGSSFLCPCVMLYEPNKRISIRFPFEPQITHKIKGGKQYTMGHSNNDMQVTEQASLAFVELNSLRSALLSRHAEAAMLIDGLPIQIQSQSVYDASRRHSSIISHEGVILPKDITPREILRRTSAHTPNANTPYHLGMISTPQAISSKLDTLELNKLSHDSNIINKNSNINSTVFDRGMHAQALSRRPFFISKVLNRTHSQLAACVQMCRSVRSTHSSPLPLSVSVRKSKLSNVEMRGYPVSPILLSRESRIQLFNVIQLLTSLRPDDRGQRSRTLPATTYTLRQVSLSVFSAFLMNTCLEKIGTMNQEMMSVRKSSILQTIANKVTKKKKIYIFVPPPTKVPLPLLGVCLMRHGVTCLPQKDPNATGNTHTHIDSEGVLVKVLQARLDALTQIEINLNSQTKLIMSGRSNFDAIKQRKTEVLRDATYLSGSEPILLAPLLKKTVLKETQRKPTSFMEKTHQLKLTTTSLSLWATTGHTTINRLRREALINDSPAIAARILKDSYALNKSHKLRTFMLFVLVGLRVMIKLSVINTLRNKKLQKLRKGQRANLV